MDIQLCAEALAKTMQIIPDGTIKYIPLYPGSLTRMILHPALVRDSLSYACHPSTISMMPSLILKSILLWTMKIHGQNSLVALE